MHPRRRPASNPIAHALGLALLLAGGLSLVAPATHAATPTAATPDADGFVPLFDGRTLDGWVNANCAPETWSVRDGVIHCTGRPTGALRTDRQYENFILEVEWRHLSSGGNSGVFIWGTPIAAPGVPFLRGIEVQVLDHGFNIPGKNEWYTTHGDVFPIHGATMKPFGKHNGDRSFPSEERSKASPEWNHYRIVATNGVLRLSVNGREVSGGENCNYRKGYLALESEGAPVEFRRLRIRELPPTGADASVTAPLDAAWRPLFTGLDFRGWNTNAAATARWKVAGERIVATATPADAGSSPGTPLTTTPHFADAEFVIDSRPAKPATPGATAAQPAIQFRGATVRLEGGKPGDYRRHLVRASAGRLTVTRVGGGEQTPAITVDLPAGAPGKSALSLVDPNGACEFMNLYARDLAAGH